MFRASGLASSGSLRNMSRGTRMKVRGRVISGVAIHMDAPNIASGLGGAKTLHPKS